MNKLGQCREHCVYVYVVARATQTDPKIMNCIFSHCRLTRFLNDDVYASAWCALVSFRLLAHLPLFVTCRTPCSCHISKMDKHETHVAAPSISVPLYDPSMQGHRDSQLTQREITAV